MSNTEDSLEIDIQILKTRKSEYHDLTPSQISNNSKKTKKTSVRQNNIIKCKEHEDNNKNTWTTIHSDCKLCTRFSTVDTLKECVLPRYVDVLNLILSLKNENNGRSWYGCSVFQECAQIVSLRWISCNVYPSSLRTVARSLEGLFDEYRTIRKYTNKSPAYWEKCSPFLQKMSHLFDIQADNSLQASWFSKTGVKHDKDFYEKQVLNPPQGYCTSKVDKVWEKSAIRREKARKYLCRESEVIVDSCDVDDVEKDEFDDENEDENDVDDFVPEAESPVKKKKKKYEYVAVMDESDDEMRSDMRYIRSSLRNVRPEVY